MRYLSTVPRPATVRLVVLVILLCAVGAYGFVTARERSSRQSRWVGLTECGWTGSAVVSIRAGLRRNDSLAAVAHERVHASQCDSLGPLRYRLNNLFIADKLALELPAYCAGARERLRLSGDTTFVRMTTILDLLAAAGPDADSAAVAAALTLACAEVAPRGAAGYRPATVRGDLPLSDGPRRDDTIGR
jgi:hypothetical protein